MAATRAIVLLSGGMDSATCLAIARADGHECHALSIDYGQRHAAELAAAGRIAIQLGAATHRVVSIGLGGFGGSALTDPSVAVPEQPSSGIPVTYVPARNTVFLALGLGLAEVLDADLLYAGMNAVDFSGYPDCRPEFATAFQQLANLATRRAVEGRPVMLCTPLMALGKADIIHRGAALGVDFAATVSCYQAAATGEACGRCEACRLRAEGFRVAGMADPTRYAEPVSG